MLRKPQPHRFAGADLPAPSIEQDQPIRHQEAFALDRNKLRQL
jgi:hypothetical protein